MRSSGNILVVDDHPANVKLLSTYLQAEGYETRGAYDGEEALAEIKKKLPDLVLLDIMMPGIDGYEVTTRIKSDPITSHIPVILVTALDNTADAVRGFDVGADEFLSKPVNRTELLARVRSLLRLKRMHDELETRVAVHKQITERQLENIQSGQELVLIVEDDQHVTKQFATVLSGEGYQPVAAASGSAARRLLGQYLPDLILLDILLPDLSGLALLSELKADPNLCDIPVIIVTSLQDIETKLKGIEAGADDYLVKPVQSMELMARIRTVMRRAKRYRAMQKNFERVSLSSVIDPLTGLRNRDYLEADIEKRIALVRRHAARTFSLMAVEVMDIDALEESHGKEATDILFQEIGRLLERNSRECDLVTHLGGACFCLVLPETVVEETRPVVDRIGLAVSNYPYTALPEGAIDIRSCVVGWEGNENSQQMLAGLESRLSAAAKDSLIEP